MFERFTERARQVVVMAQEEARLMGSDCIDEGHLLLGLIREEEGLAARVLETLHVDLDATRKRLVELGAPVGGAPSGQIPFTDMAKEILELALREALSLGHNYIGTEHLLLGLSRKLAGTECPTATLLEENGATGARIREEAMRLLSRPRGKMTQEEQAEAAAAAAHEYELVKADELKPGWYVETWTNDDEGARHGPWQEKPSVSHFGDNADSIVFDDKDSDGPMLLLTISNYASIALAHTEEESADD